MSRAVAENSGADERARARQLLDRTAVAEDSRTGKTYQPDNTAVTEERLTNLRSYQPSRGMESQGRPGTDQGERPGTEATGRTTEPQKDLAEERLASLRSHKPSGRMEEPSREIGDTDTVNVMIQLPKSTLEKINNMSLKELETVMEVQEDDNIIGYAYYRMMWLKNNKNNR